MAMSCLKPLVPLSVLGLLGWCWYTFRKRRNPAVWSEEVEMVKGGSSGSDKEREQEPSTNGSTAFGEGGNTFCQEERQGSSPYNGQNLDLEVSHKSGTTLETETTTTTTVLPGASPVVCTSSPNPHLQKGVRPEPEGEVSETQASALLAEKLETMAEQSSVDSKDLTAHGASEKDCSWLEFDKDTSTHQSPENIYSEGRGNTIHHETPSESVCQWDVNQTSSSLVNEVVRAATQEILGNGGGVLECKGQEKLRQSVQDLSENEGRTSSGPVTQKELKTVEEDPSSALQPTSPSTSRSGEDSGCSACHSEDWAGAEEASSHDEQSPADAKEDVCSSDSVVSQTNVQEIQRIEVRKNGKHSGPKMDASKGTNGVKKCVNGESRSSNRSSRTIQSLSSGLTLWDIEVPAPVIIIAGAGVHINTASTACMRPGGTALRGVVCLVGRLIGKQGKHIDFLKQNSGAKIFVSTLPYTQEFQICHIEGSQVQVDSALALVRKKFKDLDLSNRRCHVPPASLPSLPITSWLLLPQDRTVEVIVVRVEAANYLFVQQHTHPTFSALQGLNEQMLFCYSHPGCPSLPSPVEAGVVCAAPSSDGGWWRAQVIHHYETSNSVQIRYVDYGGYATLDLAALRQIRSDFVTLPFQGSEVVLENVAPLPGNEEFSCEAKSALEEITQQLPLILRVTGSQDGLPLVHMWRQEGDELISVNGLLVDRGLCSWLGNC